MILLTQSKSPFPRLLNREKILSPYSLKIFCFSGSSGVVGMEQLDHASEIEEDEPAISLTLAALPGVQIQPFFIETDELPDMDSSPDAWFEAVGVSPEVNPHFVLLADPFAGRINDLLQGLDYAYPKAVKVGGAG